MKSTVYALLLVLLSLIPNFVVAQTATVTEPTWEKFEDPQYTLQHPSDWTLDQSGKMGTSLIVMSPQSSAEDGFRENFNLIIQDVKNFGLDLDQYVKLSESQIKTMITDCQLETSERLEQGGIPCHKLVYAGSQGQFKLKFIQYYFLENDKAFVLTFTSEIGANEGYEDIGEKTLASFRLNLAALQTEATAEPSWKPLDSPLYSLEYPTDWTLDQSGKMGTSLVLMSPRASLQDQFQENINLITQNIKDAGLDLDQYIKLSETEIKAMMVDSQWETSERLEKEGLPYHKFVYTGTQQAFKLRFTQYYFMKNDQIFVLTFTSEISAYEDYKDTGEKILTSFSLK